MDYDTKMHVDEVYASAGWCTEREDVVNALLRASKGSLGRTIHVDVVC